MSFPRPFALLCLAALMPMLAQADAGTGTGLPDPGTAPDDAARYIQFVLEDDGDCILREGQHVSVRSTHPSRTIRVWLDRYYRGVGTGDRSRSELKPAAADEPLGCSRVMDGVQEWRVARAAFVD